MNRPVWALGASLASLLVIVQQGEAGAQTFSFTPTFQQTLVRYDSFAPQSDFRALGFMVGLASTSDRWQPHSWFQRYFLTRHGEGIPPHELENTDRLSGWMVSVGPAIELLRHGPIKGDFLPLVGLGSGAGGDLNGGAGVHLGFDYGFFQPRVFGQYQTLGPTWFWTLGIGMTFHVRWEDVLSDGSFWV